MARRLVWAVALCCSVAAATVVYVAPTGSLGGDGTLLQPYGSISEALAHNRTDLRLLAGSHRTNATIHANTTISAALPGRAILIPASFSPILTVQPRVSLTVTDLELVNGSALNGGAVHVLGESTLLATNCNFSRNQARRSGGAIYAADLSRLHVSSCNFDSNRAGSELHSLTPAAGGAIAGTTSSSLHNTKSRFVFNSATSGAVSRGGAVWGYQGKLLSINTSSSINNTCTTLLEKISTVVSRHFF